MNDSSTPLNPAATGLELPPGGLASFPPRERWDDWTEYDPAQWPRKVSKHYSLIPTICFNCEAACGLLAYVDKETGRIRKFEGNPAHPGSRGRNCAKGPATLNQINDPERILYPLMRTGKRGEGKWQRVTWDEVLDDLAARIRAALIEGRRNEIVYHVGRPGHELVYHQRILHSWGIDGHNSHTNICWQARAPDMLSGKELTGRRLTMPTHVSSCCSVRIWRLAIISIRTRNGSSKAKWPARNFA